MNPVSKVLRRGKRVLLDVTTSRGLTEQVVAAAFTQTKKAADLKKTVASLSQTTTTTGTTVVAPSAKHLNAIPNATGAPVTTICLPPTQDLGTSSKLLDVLSGAMNSFVWEPIIPFEKPSNVLKDLKVALNPAVWEPKLEYNTNSPIVKNLVDELQRKTLVNLTHIPIAEPISSQSVKEATASSAGPGKSISREAFLRTKYYEGFSKGHYDIKYFEDALKE